ncbi:MAG: recombinase family protein [Rhodobacterales bacterium]|nr:recombinase family protein [Rhodobacterales bacterium]
MVSELSRWGRSTQDLLDTLNRLAGWKVSVMAMSGMTFELDTPHGRMMATMLAGIAQFERDLLSERVKSGLAAARARGKKLGRQSSQCPNSDKLASKVDQAVENGRSYRRIARDLPRIWSHRAFRAPPYLRARQDGLATARKHGRAPGRPPLQAETISALQDLASAGKSVSHAVKHLSTGRSTAYKAIINTT